MYSIITILFSQLSALITMGFTTGYDYYDLSLLLAIIRQPSLVSFLGAKLSGILADTIVLKLYQITVVGVIILNISNAFGMN